MTRYLLCALACVMAAPGVIAAPVGYSLSPDKRIVTMTGPRGATVPNSGPGGYSVIVDNLAHRDPRGVYMAGLGYAFGGQHSAIGLATFAAAFRPTHSATLRSAQVAAGIIDGRNEVVISIFADTSGAPGAILWQGSARMPLAGDCCATASVSGPALPLVAGTTYRLGLSAAPNGGSTFAAWDFNVADQIHAGQVAVDTGNGWMVSSSTPDVAFALYGN